MIFGFILTAIGMIVSLVFAPFPVVEELPFGVDEYFVLAMGYFQRMAEFFPPFSTMLQVFLVYVGFRVAIIVLKFVLGTRTPVNRL